MQKQNNVSHRLVNFPNICVWLPGRKDTQNTVQYLQQDKQFTCKFTLRRVRAIIEVEKQKVLHVCVFKPAGAALPFQPAKFRRRFISSAACQVLQYLSTSFHKRYYFNLGGGGTEHGMGVSIFSKNSV